MAQRRQTPDDNTILIDNAGDTYLGLGGDDTYVLDPNVVGQGSTININDSQGNNTIRLVDGLTIQSSQVLSNQMQLTLSNGTQVFIQGADTFTYEVGGGPTDGGGTSKDFQTFVEEDLGTTVPAQDESANTGGEVSIGDDDDGGQPGDDLMLTAEADRFDQGDANATGTENDDTFTAPVGPVEGGIVSSTLDTGDSINGRGGTDRIEAEVVSSESLSGVTPLRPETQNVEQVQLNALQQNAGGEVTLNATEMTGVTQWSSFFSQGDLTLQNLTTQANTEDVVIRMDHTGNRDGSFTESDFKALFDQNNLLSGQTPGEDVIGLRVLNQDAFDADLEDAPLTSVVFQQLRFTVEQTEFDLTDVNGSNLLGEDGDATGEAITTFQELVDALNNAFDTLRSQNPNNDALDTLEATLDGPFTDPNGREGTQVNIRVTDDVELDFPTTNPNNSVFLQPSDANAVVNGQEIENSNRLDRAIEEAGEDPEDLPVTATIELEKAGRGGEGGDLTVGGMSSDPDKRGIEVFDVTVFGDDSEPSNLATLGPKKQGVLDEINIATADGAPEDPADLTIGNGITGSGTDAATASPLPGGLSEINADDFDGDLQLGTGSGFNNTRQAVEDLETLNANGGGDLEFWADRPGEVNAGAIGGDVTARIDADFQSTDVETGNGDDDIEVEDANDSEIDTNGGGDIVEMSGADEASVTAGSGNDAVFVDGLSGDGQGPTFSFNTQPADPEFFGAELRVTVNGNNDNASDTTTALASDWVSVDAGSDRLTKSDEIESAIAEAVKDPTVDEILSADGDEITVEPAGFNYDVQVELRGPAGNQLDGASGLNAVTANAADQFLTGDINTISEEDVDEAWSTYFPGSTFGDGSNSDGSIFGGAGSPNGDYTTFLDQMLAHIPTNLNRNVEDVGSGNFEFTQATLNLGGGDDVASVSALADDTVVLDPAFGTNSVLHSRLRPNDNEIDFTNLLDVEAAERGSSVNNDLSSGDSQASGFVPFQFEADGFNQTGLTGPTTNDPRATVTVTDLRNGSLQDPNAVDPVHNNIETVSFADVWDDLRGSATGEDAVPFANLDAQDLQSVYDEINPVGEPGGPGNADDPTNNDFLIVVGQDEEVDLEIQGGEIVQDSTSPVDLSKFKVFQASVAEEDAAANDFNITVDGLSGTLDLGDGTVSPFRTLLFNDRTVSVSDADGTTFIGFGNVDLTIGDRGAGVGIATDQAIQVNVQNVNDLRFNFDQTDGDNDAPTLTLSGDSTLDGVNNLIVDDGTLDLRNLDDADEFSGVSGVTVGSEIIITGQTLARIGGTITTNGDGAVTVLINDQADLNAAEANLGRIGGDVLGKLVNNTGQIGQSSIDAVVNGAGQTNVQALDTGGNVTAASNYNITGPGTVVLSDNADLSGEADTFGTLNFQNNDIRVTVTTDQHSALTGVSQTNGAETIELADVASTTLTGKGGVDTYDLAAGGDNFFQAATGGQEVLGGDQGDQITGDIGDDTLVGFAGGDTLNGSGGSDLLDPGSGGGTANGEAGDDTVLAYASPGLDLDGGADNDTLKVADGEDGSGTNQIDLNAASATLDGTDLSSIAGFENVDASNATNTVELIGDGAPNTLTGGSAGDTLTGSGGSDTFVYNAQGDSQASGGLSSVDAITDFDATVNAEQIDLVDVGLTNPGSASISDAGTGSVTTASLESDIDGIVSGDFGGTNSDIAVFEADGNGDLTAGDTHIAVDVDASGNFEVDSDMLIEVTGFTGTRTDFGIGLTDDIVLTPGAVVTTNNSSFNTTDGTKVDNETTEDGDQIVIGAGGDLSGNTDEVIDGEGGTDTLDLQTNAIAAVDAIFENDKVDTFDVENVTVASGQGATFDDGTVGGGETLSIAEGGTDNGATVTLNVLAGNTADFSGISGGSQFDAGGNDTINIVGKDGGGETITGTQENDTINGGQGADNLTGSGGDDTFVLDEFDAADTITDFEASGDQLTLDDATGASSLMAASIVGMSNPTLFSSGATGTGGTTSFDGPGALTGGNTAFVHGSNGASKTSGLSGVVTQVASLLSDTAFTNTVNGGNSVTVDSNGSTKVTVSLMATGGPANSATLSAFSLNALLQTTSGLQLVNFQNTGATSANNSNMAVTFTVTTGDTATGTQEGAINTLANISNNFDAGDILLA